MILWGDYDRDRCEETGSFDCPQCGQQKPYQFFRTYRYFHLWFIPLFRKGAVAEYVACSHCDSNHGIHVLRDRAQAVESHALTAPDAENTLCGQFGNIISLNLEAAAEIKRRLKSGGYGHEVAVRIQAENEIQRRCRIGFDVPEADGRDWIGQSHGLTILVDRRDVPMLHGATIHYDDDGFRW